MTQTSRILLVFLTGLLAACTSFSAPTRAAKVVGEQVTVPGGTYTDISAAELQTMLTNKDFTLVDVHTPFEGDIANTDLSIPYDQIGQNLEKLPAKKNGRIVLYCRSGRMSSMAAKTLVSQGYTNVWSLAGGMAAWEQAGFPIKR